MQSDNKKLLLIFLLGLVAGAIIYFLYQALFPLSSVVSISSVFSPENGNEIISIMDSAKQSLDIEMYVFTSDDILQSLKRARDRGVKIRIVLEKRISNNENQKIFAALKIYGIEVRWASIEYALTHAKFIIIDGKRVLVGSHNFSNSAMHKNREASVLIQSEKIASDFQRVFEEDWIKAI